MRAAEELSASVGTAPACRALSVHRATLYRHRRPRPFRPPRPRPTPPRALSRDEEEAVLEVLHHERFVDLAPREIYATLLDEDRYLCSVRTLYRVLERHGELQERRNQLRHPHYQKPELLATGPNQVWSWDITKLRGPVKWTGYYLYVILDIFSRYVTGWMVAHRESARLAERLIEDSCTKQGIEPGQLTLHADRGSSMTSRTVSQLLIDLGVARTHSRPHVSNDNPYSEAQFKTLKYRPDFPDRFGSPEDARAHCRVFFGWYNTEHRHTGVGLLTPQDVHYGRVDAIYDMRSRVLERAWQEHPERFVRRAPRPPPVPAAAWINPPLVTRSTQEDAH